MLSASRFKPRILHITSGMGRGGRERQLYELLRGIGSEFDIRLVVLSHDLAFDIGNLGIGYMAIDKAQRRKLSGHIKVYRYMRTFKPDIIHYWDYPSKIFALEARLIRRVFLIDGSIRFVDEQKTSQVTTIVKKLSFCFADCIVANSHAGLEAKKLNKSKRSKVIHNGLDMGRFKPDTAFNPSSVSMTGNLLKVVMVAGFQPAKDYLTLVSVAVRLCRAREDVRFLLVGDGPERQSVENQIPKQFKDRIICLGLRDDVEQILLQCDIGVLLSTSTEGLSNSIMEYMAAGLPVIATKSGGTPELIFEGVTGFMVNLGSQDEVYNKLVILIEDAELRTRMGSSGKQRITAYFSLGKSVDAYIGLYKIAVGGVF